MEALPQITNISSVEDKIITLRNQNVLLDSDVAELYGVQTKEINQAVRNNPEKFPAGYVFDLQSAENQKLVKNFDRFNKLKHSTVMPKAFTEKGLYMLATILKSEKATNTTIEIVETFTKIRELSRAVAEISETEEEEKQKQLMKKSGEILADILGNDMKTTDTETTVEINLALMKFKHTVKRKQS
ncbi:MAG: ORF6N domain-containing protein [Prevotellaceae bacterium]|jgi:phage regulator Rha-like protein|nr:ORF6N domain-containing protein [Prevotellaceae bacterium]